MSRKNDENNEKQIKKVLLILRHNKKQLGNDVKYNGIINAFKNLNYDVDYTFCDGNDIFLERNNEVKKIGTFHYSIRFLMNSELYATIRRYLRNESYYLTYIRLMPSTFLFQRMIKMAKKHSQNVVMEIPSYPLSDELKSDKRIYRKIPYVITNFFLGRTAKYVDLFAVIGEKCSSYLNRPAVNISNGIWVERLPLKTKENSDGINIIAVAKMARWHGYDRLLKGLFDYYQQEGHQQVRIYMVGNDGDGSLIEWKELASQLNLSDSIFFTGPLYGQELDELYNKCDVGIAALGMHRKGTTATSELKIREYCARGIPFVYSAEDKMLNESLDFCKRIPLDDSPVPFDIIEKLTEKSKQDMNLGTTMREYALNNMSWESQLEIILTRLLGEK